MKNKPTPDEFALIQRIFDRWLGADKLKPDRGGFRLIYPVEPKSGMARTMWLNLNIEKMWAGLNVCGIECQLVGREVETSTGSSGGVRGLKIKDALVAWNGPCGWMDIAQQHFPELNWPDLNMVSKEMQRAGSPRAPQDLVEIIKHEQALLLRQEIVKGMGERETHGGVSSTRRGLKL